MDEREAIARLKAGDISGLETLVESYQLRATRAAYLVVGDRFLAEDIVQDAFLRAYERIEQFDSTRPFGPWFLRVVVNAARRCAANRERRVSLDILNPGTTLALTERLSSQALNLEEIVEQSDTYAAVWAALMKLTPTQRATVVQLYYLGMTEKEIANQCDSPLGTVKWRLHAAREQLREWLRPLLEADVR